MAKTFPSSTCSSMNLFARHLSIWQLTSDFLVSLGRRDMTAKALVRLPRDRRNLPVALCVYHVLYLLYFTEPAIDLLIQLIICC